MHTVFINASNAPIGGRIDTLQLEKEFKKLLYVDCPLEKWKDPEKGLPQCVRQISEFANSYRDVNNEFNLIVYVDMPLLAAQAQIELLTDPEKKDPVEQKARYDALVAMLSRTVATQLYDVLQEQGRSPKEKVLLLLERPALQMSDGSMQQDEAGLSPKDRHQLALYLQLLRLPEMEALTQKLSENPEIGLSQLMAAPQNGEGVDLAQAYLPQVEKLLLGQVRADGLSVRRACADLQQKMNQLFASDLDTRVVISQWITDSASRRDNLERNTKRDFLLQAFLQQCIRQGSVYEQGDAHRGRTVPQPGSREWEQVMKRLAVKQRSFQKEALEAENIQGDFVQLELAPPLYQPDYEALGLDESGRLDIRYEEREVPSDVPREDGLQHKETVLEVADLREHNWLKDYVPYDESEDVFRQPEHIRSAASYRAAALDMANFHVDFLNRLKQHVDRNLSRYAGRSRINLPPLLRKRSVSTQESAAQTEENDYPYTGNGERKLQPKELSEENVRKTAKNAYATLMMEYLRFNAKRNLEVTSMREHCQRFIDRIKQIETSRKKLIFMFYILLAVLAVSYVPFVCIQWEEINVNWATRLIGACSLAIPFVLLYLCYLLARVLQLRKMKKLWEELNKESEKRIAENQEAVRAYDTLLTMYIPALRWGYEYVLDVDFYWDCCGIARAKCQHHVEKLKEHARMLENLLEDLRFDWQAAGALLPEDLEIDYTRAYCEGVNRTHYAIMDETVLDILDRCKEART